MKSTAVILISKPAYSDNGRQFSLVHPNHGQARGPNQSRGDLLFPHPLATSVTKQHRRIKASGNVGFTKKGPEFESNRR